VADGVEDLVELFISEHVSKTRSAREISRLLRREVILKWGMRSVHEVSKRHVIDLVTEVSGCGTPSAANKLLKIVKAFFRWCVGRAILDASPANGLAAPAHERARDRVLDDDELALIIRAAWQIDGAYGGIVELLALTGQRREEVAQLTWDEVDIVHCTWELPASRTKNGKPHVVHLSKEGIGYRGMQPTWRPGRWAELLAPDTPRNDKTNVIIDLGQRRPSTTASECQLLSTTVPMSGDGVSRLNETNRGER
jgi:integrase